MKTLVKALILLALAAADPTPVDAVRAMKRDLQKLAPAERLYTRYLLRPDDWDDAEWEKYSTALKGHLNSLNRGDMATIPRVGPLLRINLTDLGWETELWDRQQDPFTTVPVVAVVEYRPHIDRVDGEWFHWTGGVFDDGKALAEGWYRKRGYTPVIHRKAAAPERSRAIDQDYDCPELLDVIAYTGAKYPFVNAAYFFNQSAAVFKRSPNYHDWLGVKTLADVRKLAGFDRKKDRRKTELREAFSDSGVSQAPRAIVRETRVEDDGFWYATFDFESVSDEDGNNPIEVLGRRIEEVFLASNPAKVKVATEVVFRLPCGLPGFALANNKDELQDSAPDFVGRDSLSSSNDGKIHEYISCWRCHDNGAIKNLDGPFARNLLFAPFTGKVSPHDQKLIQTQYFRPLETVLKQDRLRVEESLNEACGLSSKEYSKRISELWSITEDRKWTLELAAKTLRCTPEELTRALVYQKDRGTLNPTAAALLTSGKRALFIRSRQFEDVHYLLRAYVRVIKK